MWGKIMRTIQHIAPIFKHPSFKEEREWRAISHEFSLFNTEASWRPGKNIPIPYIFFDLPKVDDKKEISEVVIGPTPNPLLSSITAMSLVKGNGYTCTKFTDSIIPYREW